MKIIDVYWTPIIDVYRVRCQCGRVNEIRVDKDDVKCPCGRRGSIENQKSSWASMEVPMNT